MSRRDSLACRPTSVEKHDATSLSHATPMEALYERVERDEFALVDETAAELGVACRGVRPVRRVTTTVGRRRVSALLWGAQSPRLVFLHGRAENAHTWDRTILGLGVPALAIDLPGHGRSDWRSDRDYMPWAAADDVAPVIHRWAPDAEAVIGVSLGGLIALRLIARAYDHLRSAVIIEASPWARRRARRHGSPIATASVTRARPSYRTLEEMVARAAYSAPHRSPTSLKRDVLHNARRRADGRWEWRHDRVPGLCDFSPLWEDVAAAALPLTVVLGSESRSVPAADIDEFRRRNGQVTVRVVPGAAHSVQADAPLAVAGVIRAALA